jgi:pilus assembly protein CpaC
MIAGLLQNDEFTTVDGIPWLQDVPILGTLFRSPKFQQNQSELIVLVEAYIVRPVQGEKEKLALPTDGFVSPSDLDLLLFGRLYKQYGNDKTRSVSPLLRGPLGYLMR